MKVLHCIYDDLRNPWVAGGGAVRVLELYRRLADDVAVTVVTGNYPGARDETVERIRYSRVGAPAPYAWSRWTYARAATRLLDRGSFDVGIFDFSVYTPIWIPRRRPVGVTVHHLTGPSARERWGPAGGAAVARAERWLLRPARWLSATSAATLEQLRAIVGPCARLVLVGNGVDAQLFDIERNEQDYLLFFGRLDLFHKGLDVLLEAMAKLVSERPGLQLTVAGRGKDADRIRALAIGLGIDEQVKLVGAVSDAERRELLGGARVLLMPSRFEGFGMVAAEAMAAGVPLVAASAGALPEVVGSDGGILVPPEDPEALAAATSMLLDDPDRRAMLSRSARRRAERFSWETVAQEHLAFLSGIAADAHGGRHAPDNKIS